MNKLNADPLPLFGIQQSKNKAGSAKWTLNILLNASDSRPRSAYFDEETRLWILEPLSEEGHKNDDLFSNHILRDPLPNSTCKTSRRKNWSDDGADHSGSLSGLRNQPCIRPDKATWLDILVPSDHTDFFRNLDWSATPLGPCATWPHALRLYTQILFSDTRPAAIYWGPQRIAIYNGSAAPLLGDLHPRLMGKGFKETMPTPWSFYGPLFHTLENGQQVFAQNTMEIPLQRDGFLEETWWNGGLFSLKDDEGSHGGIYLSWTEVTKTVLQNRRTALAKGLGQSPSATVESAWQHVHDVLAEYPRDIPMAIMYGTDENDLGKLRLQHTIGIPPVHAAVPSNLDLLSQDEHGPLVSLFMRAHESSTDFLLIDLSKEHVELAMFQSINWKGHGEPSRNLVIIPLEVGKIVRGYVMIGLNPRRPFDVDHEQTITELTRQLRELLARITIQKDTQKRELDLKEELSDKERRISRLAEVVPVGIYELATDGTLLWANTQFWEIFELPHGQRDPKTFDWKEYIHPEDHSRALGEMGRCLIQAVDISDTLRLKKYYQPPQLGHHLPSIDEPFWLIYAASPHLKPDGTVHSLMGSLTDISHLKWSEQLHLRNAEAARKERQRQEEFIDITSHEMRNPLSAITQCADSVIMSLQDAQSKSDAQSLFEIIKLNAEAAESILFCAAHQRRIINDILLLGKLDSKLLTISPKSFHPQDLVNQALQMFSAECDANDIEIRTAVDNSSAMAQSSTVCGDPSRLMQIMVNLLSNAIKFSRSRPTRKITIRYGSCSSPPPEHTFGPNFKWYTTGTQRPDLTQEPDYGRGDVFYVHYAVIDSGKGIKPEFVSNIFTKFNQAERRTHTEYGGSGLGLYISQELTEMQGGRIGIDSEFGVGSTFAFYTKVRLSPSESATPIDSTVHMYSVAKTNHALKSLGLTGLGNGLKPPSHSPSASYKILLVEDNLLNQKVLAKQLRKAGCEVRVCNHGGEAIDSILHLHKRPPEFNTPAPEDSITRFDCILMDWEMPVCDGLKASKKIRAIEAEGEKERNVIIGVTANARAEQIARAEEAGMDSVLPKPFRVVELLAKIGQYVAMPGGTGDAVKL
ncbi:hypothetical protein P171DRAFT_410014 [Karstenula rhodostoma CBS 690.94]|uniref:Uncharacterized protein n=1 Tax=Karstenula rhodostoma CBS 690.94 TaxID=1392251 RepID=A0A9P4UEB7_9PLEO|nr:hypothetical protein P171DRAFT_410014 [Karstenula rhodostoma CBS 690.94]